MMSSGFVSCFGCTRYFCSESQFGLSCKYSLPMGVYLDAPRFCLLNVNDANTRIVISLLDSISCNERRFCRGRRRYIIVDKFIGVV